MDIQTLNKLKRVSDRYTFLGILTGFEECSSGHINDTYRVKYFNRKHSEEYIVQRLNTFVFKNPQQVMDNIKEINLHLKDKDKMGCDIISFADDFEGKNYTLIDDEYWRICPFVKNSIAHDTIEDIRILYSTGYAFGEFQQIMSDFPVNRLHETIPDFHNTKKRLNDLFNAVDMDPYGRAKKVKKDITFFKDNIKTASALMDLHEKGELPLRVTHNDTKYNNILMDKDSCEPVCVIDLDTVMPGLVMYDFGDAVRSAANTAGEDEMDLSRVGINLEYFEEIAKGFIKGAQSVLTKREIEVLPLGAIVITIELASRFLTDFISGDRYFRTNRPEHNLDRARCQIKLAQSMIAKYDQMCKAVYKAVNGYGDRVLVSNFY